MGFFVLVEPDQSIVLGYYTLCATAVRRATCQWVHAPALLLASAALVGRLASLGNAAGRASVRDASRRRRAHASADTVGSSMLVVKAISERAAGFYEGNGFVRLPESLRMVLPMQTIQRGVEP